MNALVRTAVWRSSQFWSFEAKQRAMPRGMSSLVIVLAFLLLAASFAPAQTTTRASSVPAAVVAGSDQQAAALAAQARSALSGSVISDIQLSASSEWIAGSTRASGTATLKIKEASASRLDISAGAFSRSEIRNDSAGSDGQWIDANGLRHAMAMHNCWVPAGWFAPHAIVQAMSAANVATRHLGRETRGGIAFDHVQLRRTNSEKNPKIAQDLERLSTVDIFFDPATHLPITLVYNTHPDNDYERDIPVEIRFSDYRNVDGVMVPFRIQRLLQGVLNLDLTVSKATINHGLADGEFALQ